MGFVFCFILVDDGSIKKISDAEKALLMARIPNFSILHHDYNYGKGQAIRTGVHSTDSEIVMYTDINFPFGIQPLKSALESFINDVDVVFGRRDQSYHNSLNVFRYMVSKIHQFLIRLIIPKDLSDCQAGFLALGPNVKNLFLSTHINRFMFATEFARKVYEKQASYKTIDLSLRNIEPHTTINFKSIFQEFSNYVYLITNQRYFKY